VPRHRSILFVVFLTVFIDLLGFGIVIPLLPLYAERYRPTPLQFGLLMCSYSAMQFLFAPVLGRLSDRFGRRPVLLVSLAGTVAGYLLFAFARSLSVLFASRLLDGMTGGNVGTAQAVIADSTGPEERAKGMGLVGMAFGLGFIFGPAIAGFAVKAGESVPGLVAAGLSFVAFLWALLALPETRPEGAALRPLRLLSFVALQRAFRRADIGALLVLSFVTTTAFASFESTFAQFLSGSFSATPSTVAWFFVFVGVCIALVQGLLVRRLAPLLGEARLIVIGALCLVAGFFALLLVTSVPGVLFAIVLMAVGTGLLTPSMASLVSRRTPAEEQGETLGAFQSMASLGRVAGPFWGENVYLRFGARGPHLTGIILEGLVFVLSARNLLRENEAAAGAPSPASRVSP
jgi:DHA1 family tetracycline resistance protein-like MFS transporter